MLSGTALSLTSDALDPSGDLSFVKKFFTLVVRRPLCLVPGSLLSLSSLCYCFWVVFSNTGAALCVMLCLTVAERCEYQSLLTVRNAVAEFWKLPTFQLLLYWCDCSVPGRRICVVVV